MRSRMIRIPLLCLAMLAVVGGAAWPMGSQYSSPEQIVQQPAWPLGLAELIKSRPFVQAYWVNADDYFLYSGDTAEFQAFLDLYSKLPDYKPKSEEESQVAPTLVPRQSAAPLTLILRAGSGQSESFTDKPISYDWMLANRRWAPHEESQGNPLALELHVGGKVDWSKVKVPASVTVVNGESCRTLEVEWTKQMPLDLSIGAGTTVGQLRLTGITLTREGATALARIAAALLSYPKGKWTVTVDLYDEDWKQMAGAKATLESSGIALGRPGFAAGELRLGLGPRTDFDRAKRMKICLRPAEECETANAEIK